MTKNTFKPDYMCNDPSCKSMDRTREIMKEHKEAIIEIEKEHKIYLIKAKAVIEAAKGVRRNALGACWDNIWDALDDLIEFEKAHND